MSNKAFEHQTVPEGSWMRPEDFEKLLAEMGQDGWEYCGIAPFPYPKKAVFKRETTKAVPAQY